MDVAQSFFIYVIEFKVKEQVSVVKPLLWFVWGDVHTYTFSNLWFLINWKHVEIIASTRAFLCRIRLSTRQRWKR